MSNQLLQIYLIIFISAHVLHFLSHLWWHSVLYAQQHYDK